MYKTNERINAYMISEYGIFDRIGKQDEISSLDTNTKVVHQENQHPQKQSLRTTSINFVSFMHPRDWQNPWHILALRQLV